jgi:hypothetical protein
MRETGRRRRAEGVAEAAATARRVGKVAAMRERGRERKRLLLGRPLHVVTGRLPAFVFLDSGTRGLFG